MCIFICIFICICIWGCLTRGCWRGCLVQEVWPLCRRGWHLCPMSYVLCYQPKSLLKRMCYKKRFGHFVAEGDIYVLCPMLSAKKLVGEDVLQEEVWPLCRRGWHLCPSRPPVTPAPNVPPVMSQRCNSSNCRTLDTLWIYSGYYTLWIYIVTGITSMKHTCNSVYNKGSKTQTLKHNIFGNTAVPIIYWWTLTLIQLVKKELIIAAL